MPNVKIFYDHGGVENKVKFIFMTSNKRSCYWVLRLNIKSLPLKVTDLWIFVRPISCYGKIKLWPIKLRNEDAVF